MKFRECPHCHMQIALTKQNPTGACPAYACIENKVFYEEDNNQEAHEQRMKLTEEYMGLYLENESDGTFHFLYGLANNNMLFIKDTNLALYVINKHDLDEMAKVYNINNLKDY